MSLCERLYFPVPVRHTCLSETPVYQKNLFIRKTCLSETPVYQWHHFLQGAALCHWGLSCWSASSFTPALFNRFYDVLQIEILYSSSPWSHAQWRRCRINDVPRQMDQWLTLEQFPNEGALYLITWEIKTSISLSVCLGKIGPQKHRHLRGPIFNLLSNMNRVKLGNRFFERRYRYH